MQIIYPCLRKFSKNKKEFSYKRIDKLQYNWQGNNFNQGKQILNCSLPMICIFGMIHNIGDHYSPDYY